MPTDDAQEQIGQNMHVESASDTQGLRFAPDVDGPVNFYERDFYPLSNFSAFTLAWPPEAPVRFATSEEAYHWEKFGGLKASGDQVAIQVQIRRSLSAHDAFKIAERYREHRRADWDYVKVDIMRDIIAAKADQHEYVRRKLLETGDRPLIEGSWRDDFWGTGADGNGQNMLGKLWMELRKELLADGPKGHDYAEPRAAI